MDSPYECITTDHADHVLTITLNRPDKLNALNDQLLGELAECLADIEHDEDIKAVIITGAGKAFCAGADINRLAEVDAESGYVFAQQGQSVFRYIETLGKPVIAAINGYAFGGGCELAMSCHVRIASDKAKFGQPEVKLGVIPGYGGTQRLSRLVGKGRAMDLCLSGRFINATVAEQWGLVTQVTTADELLTQAQAYCQTCLGMAPLALRSVMECIDHGFDCSLETALHLEAIHFAKTCASEDKAEGVNAFLNKRDAQFSGK